MVDISVVAVWHCFDYLARCFAVYPRQAGYVADEGGVFGYGEVHFFSPLYALITRLT